MSAERRDLLAGDGIELLDDPVLQQLRVQVRRSVVAYQVDLDKRKAVFASGVAATDRANLQAAINAAPEYGVIHLFGAFTLDDQVILKPTITLDNGGGATITFTNASAHCFVLKCDLYAGAGNGTIMPVGMVWTGTVPLDPATRRCVDGYPGRINIRNIKFNGVGLFSGDARLQANNELLGTYTKASRRAAIWFEHNSWENIVEDCWIDGFDTGVFLAGCSAGRVLRNRILFCKVGVNTSIDTNASEFNNNIEYCFVGFGVNYGGLSSFTHSIKFDGVYQYCFAGVWLEGCFESSASGSLYFEGNRFRDLQLGVGGSRGAVGCAIPMIFASSACNNGQAELGSGDTSLTYTLSGNALFTGNAALGTSISCIQGIGLKIGNSVYSTGSPSGTRHIMHTDGNCDNNHIGVDRCMTTRPWLFEDSGRVTVSRGGRLRFDRNKQTPYWSYPIAFGSVTADRPYSHNDPAQAASQDLGVTNWLSYDFRSGTSRATLTVGGKDSTTNYGGEGGEVALTGSLVKVVTTDSPPLDLVNFRTGVIENSAADKYKIEFSSVSRVYFNGDWYGNGLVYITKPPCHPAPTVLASAGTISITQPIHKVSGVAAISTINGTTELGFGCGTVVLIPTGVFTWTAGGNIALAGTAVVGKALHMTYVAADNKWYPSYTV